MADFLQTLIITVTIGSLYALIALGYTMVYGILKLINFAHSDIVVWGAWISFTAATFLIPRVGFDLSAPPWYAGVGVLILAMSFCAGLGFVIERFAYRPLRSAPRLNALITAIGVSLLLQNVGQLQREWVKGDTIAASGSVQPGAARNQVRLSTAVTIDPNLRYDLYLQPGNASTPTLVDVTSSPGQYAAGADVTISRNLGKAQTRDATFELHRVTTSLKFPFGAMPAASPALLPKTELYRHEFTTLGPIQPDGSRATVRQPLVVSLGDVVIVITAVLLMVALQLLVFKTKLGTAMRAVSYNVETAALMGIPVDRVISFTFVVGAALAAAAGFLYAVKYSPIQQPAHATWVLLGMKAFVAAVVGGIGNIRGAAAGGFLIAFIEQFGGRYGTLVLENSSAFTDVYVFLLLIVVLLVKPTGLFGTMTREKV